MSDPAQALTQDGTGRVLGAQLTARVIGWHGSRLHREDLTGTSYPR